MGVGQKMVVIQRTWDSGMNVQTVTEVPAALNDGNEYLTLPRPLYERYVKARAELAECERLIAEHRA